MKTIYSVGHSNKKGEELVELLLANGITDLVDVRTYPRSKWNPQFNRAELEVYIPKAGMRYHWRGNNLGGLAGNVDFNETITKLLNASSDERRICVMCSEAKPEDCHRSSTIEPEVIRQGGQVIHILWTPKKENAKMEESAQRQSLFD